MPLQMSNGNERNGLCPACGRFAGRADCCEYCDADMPGSGLRKICRICAWFSIAASIAALWYATELRRVPEVSADDITPSMNHALVRINGRVASTPFIRVSESGSEYASFLLSNGGQSVRICLKGLDAVQFSKEAGVQCKGCRLEAVGVLQVRFKSEPRLFARSVGGLPSWKLVM